MCDEVPPLKTYTDAQLRRQCCLVDERNIAFFLCCQLFSPFLLHTAAPVWLWPPTVARRSEGPFIAACGFNFN